MLQEHIKSYVTALYVATSSNNHLILMLLLGFDEKMRRIVPAASLPYHSGPAPFYLPTLSYSSRPL